MLPRELAPRVNSSPAGQVAAGALPCMVAVPPPYVTGRPAHTVPPARSAHPYGGIVDREQAGFKETSTARMQPDHSLTNWPVHYQNAYRICHMDFSNQ